MHACAATLVLWAGAFSHGAMAADVSQPRAVVELFTSQGCSSCPPADEILSGYAKKGDVLALSWHVDYWNYLGWKDTFSQAKFTKRQQRYAASFARRGVYTPQAVINGRNHAVGSRAGEIKSMINQYERSGKGLTVPIKAVLADGRVELSAQSDSGDATMYIVYFDKERTVKIQRGENSGQTITYHNVVRDIAMLGMLGDSKLNVSLSLAELKEQGAEACAIILQKTTPDGTPGAIIGATIIGGLTS